MAARIIHSSVLLKCYPLKSFLEVHIDCQEFENAFKDSGYLDYFLLSFYDYSFRVYFVYTLLFASDCSISEKSSWVLGAAILSPLLRKAHLELDNLNDFFFFVIVFFFFTLSVFILCFSIVSLL